MSDSRIEIDVREGKLRARDERGVEEEIDYDPEDCVVVQKGQDPAKQLSIICGDDVEDLDL